MELPSYYSILTADVRYDRRLGKPNARELYSEITALSNKDGYCHASNGYFAKLYDLDNGTISRWISLLEECGYLQREIIYHEGTKQVKERRLYPISTPIGRKRNTPPQKNQGGVGASNNTPIGRKRKENNTSINTTSKNKIDDDSARADLSDLDIQLECHRQIQPIAQYFERNFGQITQTERMKLLDEYRDWYEEGVPKEDITAVFNKVIEKAALYRAKAPAEYSVGILKGYLRNKIWTVEAIEGEDKQFEAKKQQRQSGWSNRRNNASNEVEWYE
ncbi:helix-turn-helix domain-containing protein [Ligilactobacillus animalis]|uniref:helix-turn-helix domain-containing protein n=1 Tax=Ligilactobacillus animalis TaxID=1605 RepID=UPI0010A52974|nr:helix-turn-helix domain-containing protein [Ligilactobacillus animalis]